MTARLDCPDAAAIEAVLERAGDPPADWKELLDEFAAAPAFERWQELMRFVPDEHFYQRHRKSIRYLRRRGVEPNLLFRCASTPLSPEAIELVEDGLVAVETILARGEGSPARATFLGLAAEAAYLAGDLLGAIRLLRESMACETELVAAFPHIVFVRERASEEEQAALDRAGIPRH